MSKRIIYVRTPKTAGTSVDEVLRQRFESPIQIDGKTKHWPSQAQLE